jgi:hypothetical protein
LVPVALPRLAVAILLFAACGKNATKKPGGDDGGITAPVAAPIALPPLGVERLTRFNFIFDSGRAAHDKAEAAAKKQDWPEVTKQAEAALAKDPHHYDAHRLLAIAHAQTGEHAAAVDHLVTAIAADYYHYGPSYEKDPLLEGFRASQHGAAVSQLTRQIGGEWSKRVAGALWFIGRRNPFRYDKHGVQWLSSRGELYAFDRETRRYFRLTHTNHQVAGFLRARATSEVAVLGFDKGDRPAKDDAAPLLARAWVQVFDPATWTSSTPKITFGPARAAAVHYAEGDQLLVGQAPATGRWTLGAWAVSSVDRSTGKLTKVTQALGAPRIELTLDEGRVVLPATHDGVQAAWAGDPARAPELTVGSTRISVPESGQAAQESLAVAPGGAHLAFATAVDPCAKDAAPSLYVANTKTGALKHLLTARSRFATRWLDANTLAYEDGDSAIRLWDAASGREALRIENKAGVALAVLSVASAPLCIQTPPVVEPGTGGADDELPPEEPSGPVVTPP